MQNPRRVYAKFHPDFQEKVGTKISIDFLRSVAYHSK